MTESSKPPLGRMKARAPPPPPQAPQPAPRHIFRNNSPDGGGTSGTDTKENMLRPTVDFKLTLPQGYQTSLTEEGSKALMDLLVELCSRYHLNPALHTLELQSPEGHTLGFKPNALLGSLNVACVLIKEKVWEEKVVRRPAPKVPEKTVRLMVNYHGSQKAVVRVNPLLPLHALTPVICDKCEFDPAHVLLLKDSISRRELPLDKSLSELGIKELYVHDQTLVLQPKMASAPVLNYSDPIHTSTTSLGRTDKKGLLGIFPFGRRKSKTETTSLDMDNYDDKVIQNNGTQSNGLSTVSGVPSVGDRPGTLGQSQSVMNTPNMSPKTESKKRRAPAPPEAPTPIMGHTRFEGYQMGPGSESQQRKRKAPAPPPTPTSITPGSDDTLTSAASTSDIPATELYAKVIRTKQTSTVPSPSTTVVVQTVKPIHSKTVAQPATSTASSPTPSSSTIDSQAVQDSSSELSHSLDDSDVDLDQAGSSCSTLTSSTVSGSVRVQPITKTSSNRMEESEPSSSMAAKSNQEETSDSSSRSETESALNLKLDEVENNRHSGMGTTDQPAPPKPRRSMSREAPPLVLSPTLSTIATPSLPIEPTKSNSPESPMEVEEAAPQSWLHSMRTSTVSGQKPETETPEEETLSVGSSSGGSSLPDQGYAASEGMVEGEDSGMVSSPSDTQPTSPDGSLSLDGSSRGGVEKQLGPVRDNSSDSDEGCATWGSRHRHKDISPQAKSGKFKEGYEDDSELKAQLQQTLADLEENLADHLDMVSAKETPYTMSTDSNEVPVSVVDMDVPVTAIDEVLEDYERNFAESNEKLLTRTVSNGKKGFCHQSSSEPQNKNNNACTAADSNKSSSANTKQPSQPEQCRNSVENKSIGDKKGEKIIETKIKEMSITNSVTEDKQRPTSAVKSNVDVQKQSKSSEIKSDPVKNNAQSFEDKKPVLPLNSQISVSRERVQDMHKVQQNNLSFKSLHSQITENVTSRFGMKTFTVVPPKPSVVHAATGDSAVPLISSAIKIDDQGNMVKAGVSQNKVSGSSESGVNGNNGFPSLGNTKAFWSLNERQESVKVPHSKSQIDKAKGNKDGPTSAPNKHIATSEMPWKTNNTEYLKTTQSTMYKPADRTKPKEIKEEAKELQADIHVAKEKQVEVDSKISVPKTVQQPSNKPAVPTPLLPDPQRDLSFLRPSRRTSSHYVASAISRYAPKTSAKPTPNVPDSSALVKTVGFQRSGRSIQVNPHQSSQSSSSDNKENDSASKPNPSGPKRYPDSQRNFGEVRPDKGGFGGCAGSTKGSLSTLEAEMAKNKHIQSSGPSQTNVTANNDRDNIKHIQPRSPNPAQSSPPHSSAKPPTVPKTISQSQTSNTTDMTKAATCLTPDARPQPSVTVSEDSDISQPVTAFGPVKKFRPVICRSVEKETSLHSSLMEAIQTGGGRERLKKISTSGPSSMNKASYVEEENERSALLADIRAQSNSSKLKKTKSEAAHELEKFRKVASQEEKSANPPSSPSVVTPPPPPPPAPTVAPPPPVLPQGKPGTVANSSANTPLNPALAREAMLEAIRSGSAAERLKKIAVPKKTVQVNGRLGTIRATSSALPQQ